MSGCYTDLISRSWLKSCYAKKAIKKNSTNWKKGHQVKQYKNYKMHGLIVHKNRLFWTYEKF